MVNISLRDVAKPQHVRSYTRGDVKMSDGTTFRGGVVMDIYTGTLTLDFYSSDLGRTTVRSFVPLGPPGPNGWEIQDYISGNVTAIVSASLSGFGGDPDLAAVDAASVRLVTTTFPGRVGNVLVIDANVAVDGGSILRVAYQVTALVAPQDPNHPIAELGNHVLGFVGETAPLVG
jgi:hypothetical protein